MAALKKFNSYMGGFYFSLTRVDSRQAMRFLSKKSYIRWENEWKTEDFE